MAWLFPRYAAHLEDVHKIGFIGQFDIELKLLEVEILKGKIIKQRVRRKQLLTADMDRVLGNLIRVPHGAPTGGQFNLGGKGLLRAGREHHGAIAVDAQLQPAEKARVVMEKSDVGRPGRHDVTGNGGGKKRFAVDE